MTIQRWAIYGEHERYTEEVECDGMARTSQTSQHGAPPIGPCAGCCRDDLRWPAAGAETKHGKAVVRK